MKLKELFTDDEAVSPVIGVILMVAITVILAAVIASFVLGVGQNAPNKTPSASFAFEYTDSDGNGEGYVEITHDGGDPLEARELYVRGQNAISGSLSGSDSIPNSKHKLSAGSSSIDKSWEKASAYGASSELNAGDYVYVKVKSTYDLSIVWQSTEGDTTATLTSDKGPDA